jgi:quercetin dioxygenase-like cupin family protein
MPETLGLTDVWASSGMPPRNGPGDGDGVPAEFAIAPGPQGTLFRVVQFPPAGADAPGPLWHRTDTLDYNVVVEGEVWLLTEGGEARLGAGDCAVVRGITHAWDNRSGAVCVLAAVAIAARPG